MFDAQLLQPSTVYSPWFARGGDNVICTLDLIQLGGSASIRVDLYSKSQEDTGDGSPVDPSGSPVKIEVNAAGRAQAEWSVDTVTSGFNLSELVRYKFTVSTSWVLFRMLPPVWFDSVAT